MAVGLLFGGKNFTNGCRRILTRRLAKVASKARKDSFVSANPLALGTGVGGARNGALPTPLGWLTDKLTGVSGR